jgi:hypothetical protein
MNEMIEEIIRLTGSGVAVVPNGRQFVCIVFDGKHHVTHRTWCCYNTASAAVVAMHERIKETHANSTSDES